MSQFYCREDELRKLNKRYAGDKFECIVIYGRRRVGKTALINEFCKDKPTIFFSALNTTGKENLEALSKSIMSFERPDMESAPEFRSYDAALDELTALSKEKRIVFVIDEYPYLAKAKPAISAMLQHIIDHKWTESKMYLILCGSSMSFMESQVLGKKETPITEKPGKKTIYLLADNFFRFWYRFVPINMSAIDSGRIAKIYPHAVKQYLPDYMGLIFEKMCQDYLLYYSDSLPIELSEIGQWWGTDPKKKKQTQIDIVGTPVEGKDYIIGSCKYRNEKIGVDELDLIRDYASVFGKGNNYYYYIFSKGGFTDGLLQAQERGEVRLITLEDLYK